MRTALRGDSGGCRLRILADEFTPSEDRSYGSIDYIVSAAQEGGDVEARTAEASAGLPRPLIVAPALMALGAAIYFTFSISIDFASGLVLAGMWLAHLGLFLTLVITSALLWGLYLRVAGTRTAATGLCLLLQVLVFILALRAVPDF